MVIGIDSSRAFVGDKTGTENYSYMLISAMLRLPESRSHSFVLFIRPNAILPHELIGYTNVKVKEIKLKYLWTQAGLAWETWFGEKIDLLWVPAHTLPVLRKPGLKTVVTIHGLEYQWLKEYKNWLQKWYLPLSTYYAANSADKLIAVSEFTKKQLQKELHTSSKKINVIHEGVELNEIKKYDGSDRTLGKHGLTEGKYLLFVGTVQPRKNLIALIEAFSLAIHSEVGRETEFAEYKLAIVGGVGWMSKEIFEAPTRFNIQDKVVFTGRVNDLELHELYLGAKMYIQPSITEGFGLPLLEAMNASLPVITSDGGALPEVVGDAGIVVQLGDRFVANLAKSMLDVVENKKIRTKLVDAGEKRVNEFSWTKAAKETLKVLENA